MTVDIDFLEARSLSVETVNSYLAPRATGALVEVGAERPDPSVEVRSGVFTQYVWGQYFTTYFNVSQRNRLFQAPDGSTAVQNLYAIEITTRHDDPGEGSTRSRRPIDRESAYVYLTPGRSVAAVYYGDADSDGLNDILIRFSDGIGLLYHGRRTELP